MLAYRDRTTEIRLLSTLSGINYVLLQRDWSAPKHGDLDLAVDVTDWPSLVRTIVLFCHGNDICIAKAYEIERAVVCIVLVTRQGYVQIDVAITPQRREMFGADLQKALESRELVAEAYAHTEIGGDLSGKQAPLQGLSFATLHQPDNQRTCYRTAYHRGHNNQAWSDYLHPIRAGNVVTPQPLHYHMGHRLSTNVAAEALSNEDQFRRLNQRRR